MEAYVRYEISKEDLALGQGCRLQILMWQKFYYTKKGQRKLLTQTSEGGQRMPHCTPISYWVRMPVTATSGQKWSYHLNFTPDFFSLLGACLLLALLLRLSPHHAPSDLRQPLPILVHFLISPPFCSPDRLGYA